jgi:hypothetical protein
MRKQIEINIPDNWNDISLKQYIAIQRDLEAYKEDPTAQMDFLIFHLCGITADEIQSLTTESYNKIKNEVMIFFDNQKNYELQPIVKIGDTEYGFEPNLSQMSYGAYVDITKWDTIELNENWAKIMSILYRPIVKKQFGSYLIEPYEGYINEKIWLNQKMDIHFGAYFFFVLLSKDLVSSTLNSMSQTSEISPSMKSILDESGKVIRQL